MEEIARLARCCAFNAVYGKKQAPADECDQGVTIILEGEMNTWLSFNPETLTGVFETSDLLRQGIDCIRQGRYIEGAACFALAREHLSPELVHCTAAIDMFMQGHAHYLLAQQALHQASHSFAEADAEQQKRLVALEELLPALHESTVTASQPDAKVLASDNSRENPLPQTHQQLSSDSSSEELPSNEDDSAFPRLYITCFGRFEVRRSGKPVTLCSSRSGQCILRYIIAKPGHYARSDILQALLWPEDEPEVAQRKLHIAISALRRSLSAGHSGESGYSYIVCKNRTYYFTPPGILQTDVDEFLSFYQAGQQKSDQRIAYYEKACRLYTGSFLTEDIYADWPYLQREQLSNIYLNMCRALIDHYFHSKRYEDAIKWITAILAENRCDEAAHQQLIRIYAAQGRRHEALQQFQRCERLLRDELGVEPMPETVLLLQQLLVAGDSNSSKEKI